MKKIKSIEKTVTVDDLEDQICDRCNNSMVTYRNADGHIYTINGTWFTGSFSYGSEFDLETWEFDLCDECCKWLRSQLNHIETQ